MHCIVFLGWSRSRAGGGCASLWSRRGPAATDRPRVVGCVEAEVRRWVLFWSSNESEQPFCDSHAVECLRSAVAKLAWVPRGGCFVVFHPKDTRISWMFRIFP
eukprot:7382175-Prymnesium_polylepis.1